MSTISSIHVVTDILHGFPPVNSTVFRNCKWLRSAAERTAYSPLTVYADTHQTSGGGKAGGVYHIADIRSGLNGLQF